MLKSGIRSEAEEQAILFEWAEYVPELENMYAIPNGGSRHPAEARNLKRQGVKSGVPDVHLALPRGNYHGLYIEMKVGKNKTSKNQDEWIERLSKAGYCCAVCYGFEQAQKTIINYLALKA